MEAAYRLHADSVYGLIRTMCGPVRASETTVEIFTSLRTDADVLASDPVELRSRLLTLAHQHAVGWLRGDPTRSRGLASMRAAEAERDAIATVDVRTRKLLWCLPRFERQAIVLAYFGGQTRRSIAELLRRSDHEVAGCLRAGLTDLQRLSCTSAVEAPSVDEHLAAVLAGELSTMEWTRFGPPGGRDRWVHLADLAVSTIEGCDSASIAVMDRVLAPSVATTEIAADIDALQRHAGGGPSFDAMAYALPLCLNDLATDTDWPSFGAAAAAAGASSLLTIPLGDAGGVFNLYGSRPEAFTAQARAVALVIALLADQVRVSADPADDPHERAANLRAALRAKELIAQAQGIIMGREQASAPALLADAARQVSLAVSQPIDISDR